MKYLGTKIPKKSEFGIEYGWRVKPAYVLCPVDDPDKQMQCLKYTPCNGQNWQCRHCDCGASDICSV